MTCYWFQFYVFVATRSYNPDQAFYDFLALEMKAMFILALIFLSVGLLLGCAMKQYKRSGSTAVAIILITYFMSILTWLSGKLGSAQILDPFKYFDAAELYRNAAMSTNFLLLSGLIIVVCVAAGYWFYNKRDLYI